MLVELKRKPARCASALLDDLPVKRVPYPEEDHVVAGSGPCRACRREGKPNKCGGYISTGYSPYACKTCGHAYDQHE